MKRFFVNIFLLPLFTSIFVFGCANQIPPSGGDDDLVPPKILKIVPGRNALNYSGNKVSIDFSEYVDRRSLKDAIFISPKPSGELNYSWSGTSVEIEFPGKLQKNTTYTFIIGKGLKDIHNNSITAPIQFAFSTGPAIDNGKISGKVYTQKSDNVMILAYVDRGLHDSLLNPNNKFPDFFTQLNEENMFSFYHLPKEKFRLFALKDNNRNLLYDVGADEISVLNGDIKVEDTVSTYNANFLFKDYIPEDNFIFADKFIQTLLPADTVSFMYSSFRNKAVNIPVDSRFVFYFKNNKLSRFDIAENLRLTDTSGAKSYRLLYNWASDSVLELTPTEELKYSSSLKMTADFKGMKYFNEIFFSVADERKSGSVSGRVSSETLTRGPVFVKIYNQDISTAFYSKQLEGDSLFAFKKIPEGKYILFSYVDSDKNKTCDYGNSYPFRPSEKFMILEPVLNLKGGWKIENVFIKF
ncbi:MAG: Ig-like domain-containing protein [Ignavibacteriae bacterium]|nr:Ig-like domain-containing protein [Ignavibacteriota bacterium]